MDPIELFDDDIEQLYDDLSSEPWLHLSNEDVRNSSQLPIRISYQYVDMGKSNYGFNQKFTEKDVRSYFEIMKRISGSTLWNILDDDEVVIRRHRSLHKPLRRALDLLNEEITKGDPIIFHFHLYTNREQEASRETGIRSPRVYFMQGLYGVIYVLFFDPFHEITR